MLSRTILNTIFHIEFSIPAHHIGQPLLKVVDINGDDAAVIYIIIIGQEKLCSGLNRMQTQHLCCTGLDILFWSYCGVKKLSVLKE